MDVPEDRGLLSPVLDELSRIPGISSIQEISVYPLQDLDDVAEKALAAYQQRLAGQTFAVRARRSGKHDFTSSELERQVGGYLLAHTDAAGVRLKEPDVEVRIDVREAKVVDRRGAQQAQHPGFIDLAGLVAPEQLAGFAWCHHRGINTGRAVASRRKRAWPRGGELTLTAPGPVTSLRVANGCRAWGGVAGVPR